MLVSTTMADFGQIRGMVCNVWHRPAWEAENVPEFGQIWWMVCAINSTTASHKCFNASMISVGRLFSYVRLTNFRQKYVLALKRLWPADVFTILDILGTQWYCTRITVSVFEVFPIFHMLGFPTVAPSIQPSAHPSLVPSAKPTGTQ